MRNDIIDMRIEINAAMGKMAALSKSRKCWGSGAMTGCSEERPSVPMMVRHLSP